MILLNARSFNKHAIDIFSSSILIRSDLIGFNEPKLLNNSTSNVNRLLEPFYLVLNDMVSNGFCDLAFVYRSSVSLLPQISVSNTTFFRTSKKSFLPYQLNISLLYRTNTIRQDKNGNQSGKSSRVNGIDIILGNFNRNALQGINCISTFLSKYKMFMT